MLGLLAAERTEEDGAAAGAAQAVGEGGNHGRGDAPTAGGLQSE
jgi:hypothetical protein